MGESSQSLILGIDPGVSGAYALISTDSLSLSPAGYPSLHFAMDLPLRATHSNKKQVDPSKFSLLLKPLIHRVAFCVIEDVHVIGAKGGTTVSSFTFGKSAGLAEGVLAAHGVQVFPVLPSVWKAALALSSDKQESVTRCEEVFGKTHFIRPLVKKDHGKAEASLLAYYGFRFLLPILSRSAS